MPRIDFYFDADDKFVVAARLAQKAVAAGMRLLISAPDGEIAQRIDRSLWTFAPQSFVPHALENSPLAGESPVVVVQKIPGNATSEFQILLNLADVLPSPIDGFGRVIEIVSQDDDDRALARDRFKAYREQGYEMVTHRLGQNE